MYWRGGRGPTGSFYEGDCSKTAIIWVDKEGSLAITAERLAGLGIDATRIFTALVSLRWGTNTKFAQEDTLGCDGEMATCIKESIKVAETRGFASLWLDAGDGSQACRLYSLSSTDMVQQWMAM